MAPASSRTRTLRGAVCGAIAAAVWGLEQPLDRLVFRDGFDDVELLGRAVVSGDGWYPVGFAMHMANGAAFGAIYSRLADRLEPIPPVLRGPAAAMVEHLASWPLVAITDRFHPRRAVLPRLSGNRSAFLQATYRHLLFGLVLGELERRVNAEEPDEDPVPSVPYSSNGHGSLEHAVAAPGDA
jgi:hypothetical protein